MKRAEILAAAERCVCGDRELDYGKPENNFGTIANLWEAYLVGVRHITAMERGMLIAGTADHAFQIDVPRLLWWLCKAVLLLIEKELKK